PEATRRAPLFAHGGPRVRSAVPAAPPRSGGSMRPRLLSRPLALVACLTTLITASTAVAVVHSRNASASAPVPPSLTAAIDQVTPKPEYARSTWRFQIEDRDTGEVLFNQGGGQLATTGSTLKVYSTATALHLYGADHRFHTPVFRTGPMQHGTVRGNLVLVASGDFSMGLREQPNGSMAFAS